MSGHGPSPSGCAKGLTNDSKVGGPLHDQVLPTSASCTAASAPQNTGSKSTGVKNDPPCSSAVNGAREPHKPMPLSLITSKSSERSGMKASQDPLRLTYPASSSSSSNHKTSRTPNLFRFQKLRSGKWIPEEEEYAELLIALFEKGRVTDCDNGMTLRSYLSQKLHCAPMRISKKFAGKGIGKMIYLSQLSTSPDIPFEETFKTEQKLEKLENAFYGAVFPEAQLNVPQIGVYPPQTTSAVPSVPLVSGLVPIITQPFQIASAPVAPTHIPGQLTLSIAPEAAATAPVAFTAPAQANALAAIQSSLAGAQSFPMMVNTSDPHTLQLQMSFLNALSGHPNLHAAAATLSSLTTPAPSIHHVSSQPLPPAPPIVKLSSSDSSSKQSPLKTPTPPKPIPSLQPAKTDDSIKQVLPKTAEIVPDFLAGFDEVAGNGDSKPSKPPKLTVLNPEYSPPFTSKSFDDFHRLLGKDVDEIAKPANNNPTGPVQSVASIHPRPQQEEASKAHAPDPMALFSADSYAMFAQESVLSMGHHSAYGQHATDKPSSAMIIESNTHVGPDLKGTSNQLATNENTHTTGTVEDIIKATTRDPSSPFLNSTYGQVVGNPLTQIAPTMDNLKDMRERNFVSGSERASSASDPSSNNEAESSTAPEGTSGSSEDNSNDSETGSSSSDGCSGSNNEDDGESTHLRKKRRLEERTPLELGHTN